jgi:4-amino-4-deoxychorismate lyase
MYLLNGERKQSIEFSDRGFQYGDGLFETIEVQNERPLFFEQHCQRLYKGCQRLLITEPDIDRLKKEAYQLSKGYTSAVLKIIVTRGSGGRGYRQPDQQAPSRLLSLHPFPEYPESFSQQGIVLRFCDYRLGLTPSLAGIKHMNRLEQVLARAEWNSPDVQEGLVMDINDSVIEGTMSNLFLVKNNTLYTPLIDQCGIEGIVRNILITLAKRNEIEVVETKICKENVLSADEVFMTNSVIGIWPVKQIERQSFKIRSMTKKCQHLFLDARKREIERVC